MLSGGFADVLYNSVINESVLGLFSAAGERNPSYGRVKGTDRAGWDCLCLSDLFSIRMMDCLLGWIH